MILEKYDYKGYHAVNSVNGYEGHIRIYKIGDKRHNLLYERTCMGDCFTEDELKEITVKFVDKKIKIDKLKERIKEIKNDNERM